MNRPYRNVFLSPTCDTPLVSLAEYKSAKDARNGRPRGIVQYIGVLRLKSR